MLALNILITINKLKKNFNFSLYKYIKKMPRRTIIKKDTKGGKIIGQIMGGLGNQLFIIFTTIAYAIENNFQYSIVNVERKRKSYFDTPLYKNIKVHNDTLKGFKIYREPHYHYSKIPSFKFLTINGYFQSYKYFDQYKDQIINQLELLDCRQQLEGYDGYLHFRLGDYKNIECHPVCDIQYYVSTLTHIGKENLKFIYFFEEEDRQEIDKKISILREKFPSFTFEPIDTNMVDYQQMLSMTTLKYCVIANSSFSWWGAYLNQREDKIVYYPSQWFTGTLNEHNISDLCLDNWIRI